MAFHFRCPGVGGACPFSVTGSSLHELRPAVLEHLRVSHQLDRVSGELLGRLDGGFERLADGGPSLRAPAR